MHDIVCDSHSILPLSERIIKFCDERFNHADPYKKIPDNLRMGLARYLLAQIMPGTFLTAVLCNDLCKAVFHADAVSRQILPELISWLYNEAPGRSWGSPENVNSWITSWSNHKKGVTDD